MKTNIHYTLDKETIFSEVKDFKDAPKLGDNISINEKEYEIIQFDLFKFHIIYKVKEK
jgi:hypothetical protein